MLLKAKYIMNIRMDVYVKFKEVLQQFLRIVCQLLLIFFDI